MSDGKTMSVLNYIKAALGMSAKAFLAEWQELTKEQQESMKADARKEAAAEGIVLSN